MAYLNPICKPSLLDAFHCNGTELGCVLAGHNICSTEALSKGARGFSIRARCEIENF